MPIGFHDRTPEEGQICVFLVGEMTLTDKFRPELVDVPDVPSGSFRESGAFQMSTLSPRGSTGAMQGPNVLVSRMSGTISSTPAKS